MTNNSKDNTNWMTTTFSYMDLIGAISAKIDSFGRILEQLIEIKAVSENEAAVKGLVTALSGFRGMVAEAQYYSHTTMFDGDYMMSLARDTKSICNAPTDSYFSARQVFQALWLTYLDLYYLIATANYFIANVHLRRLLTRPRKGDRFVRSHTPDKHDVAVLESSPSVVAFIELDSDESQGITSISVPGFNAYYEPTSKEKK